MCIKDSYFVEGEIIYIQIISFPSLQRREGVGG